MEHVYVDYQHTLLSPRDIEQHWPKVHATVQHIRQSLPYGYASDYAMLSVP